MPGSCRLCREFSTQAALKASTRSGFTWIWTWTISMGRLAHLVEFQEDDARRVADGGVMARESEAARLAVQPEDGDAVAALVATKEESAGGVEVEAAGIIPARP